MAGEPNPAGTIVRDDIGYETGYTSGGDLPAFLYFTLFVPLQAKEWCAAQSSDMLQRFNLYRRIEVDASTTLEMRFVLGNIISFYSSETGVIDAGSKRTTQEQVGYVYGKRAFRKLQAPPVKTLPAYVEGALAAQVTSGTGSAKIFNVDFQSLHDDDFTVTYDDKAIRHDMSTQDLIDYNMPASSFLIRDLLIRLYNVMIHEATANYSFILFGGTAYGA